MAKTMDAAAVAAAEAEYLDARGQARSGIGIAFAGGGIRAATLSVGVAEELMQRGIIQRADYLSTVSGGGYAGACLSHLLNGPHEHGYREPLADDQGDLLGWLRLHASYLVQGPGFSAITLAAGIVSGTLMNLAVLLPLLIAITALFLLDWPIIDWPQASWLPQDEDGFALLTLLGFGLLGVFVLMVFIASLTSGRRTTYANRYRVRLGKVLMAALGCLAVGSIPLLNLATERFLSEAYKLLHVVAFIGAAALADKLRWQVVVPAALALAVIIGIYHLADLTQPLDKAWFWTWAGIALVLSALANINWVSMYSYYRARLSNAFLPPFADREDQPPIPLTRLGPRAGMPLHVINTTLATINSPDAKLRARGGANFIFSAVASGCDQTGYRATADYLNDELDLATVFTISGAAISPDSPQTRAPALSFVMALLNVRLGYWIPSPASAANRLRPFAWLRLLPREMLGYGLSEAHAELHLADGGQFDNSALYELIRRRCQTIIAVTSSYSQATGFAELGALAERVRVDFNAQVDVPIETGHPGLMIEGKITYDDGSEGTLYYLVNTLPDALPVELAAWAHSHADFPHTSTANQFYGEAEFEAYRQLGRLMAKALPETA